MDSIKNYQEQDRIERELYDQKMQELDEFQDMLYENEGAENSNINLLPRTRKLGKLVSRAEALIEKNEQIKKKRLTPAERRVKQIDKEVTGFMGSREQEFKDKADM